MKSSRHVSRAVVGDTPRARSVGPADVSVVLCTRDRAAMLDRALSALHEALPAATEVIVVDSGSTSDETRLTAERHEVRYVRSDTPGLSIARNVGVSASAREVVVFTDDDCLVAPDFLAPLIEPFASPLVGATAGRLRDIADTSPRDSDEPVATLTDVLDGLDAGHGALMAFRRSVIADLAGFDPVLGAGRHFGGAEDMDAFCRVLNADLQVIRVPTAVVHHVFTRNDADYLRLERNYGLGIGAMCAKWWRAAPKQGRRLTARVARRAVGRYARRIRDTRSRRGQSAYIAGVLAGIREARKIAVTDLVFVDTHPPAPVSVATAAVPSEPTNGRTA